MAWATPDTYTVGQLLTAASMNKISSNLLADNTAGSMKYVAAVSAGNTTESQWQSGWLECNGAAVSRTTYATLFAYLNGLSHALPFGTGNGTTTFNVPDMQGRIPVHNSISGPAAVTVIGNSDGVSVANRRPQHRHTTHTHTGGNDTSTTTGSGGTSSSVGSSGATTTGAKDGGSGTATDTLDAPAYLVGGIWVIKF